MKKNNSDPIADLTAETTKLLNEVAGQKARLQSLANTSESNVNVSKSHADRAATEHSGATTEATRSETEATRSEIEANRSQTAADRAELVSGMDTAQQLVDVAVTEGFVPVQAQIDAVQADTKLPIVHAPLDNKLSLHAGVGEPVFVKSANQTVEIPAQNITVGADTVTIPQQKIVVEGQEIEVPDAQQIKFNRASSAWLDGKEYAADEPRYTKDGQLLVEEQNTNYMTKPFPYNFYMFLSETVTWSDNGEYATVTSTRVDGAIEPVYFNLDAHCNAETSNARTLSLTVLKTELFNFTVRSYPGGAVNHTFRHDIPLPSNSKKITVIDHADSFTVYCHVLFDITGSDQFFRIYPSYDMSINTPWSFKNLMISEGMNATSYIPTNGTAVTRAADIALINGQNIVSRWENDQQPISTDTPRLLANGEHDMSADRLVKFGRSTSAWLDGVEYAAGEPRYKDGKLLVESQNTNYLPTPFPYDTLVFKKSDPLTTCTVTAVDGWSDHSIALASGHGYFDIFGSATLYNTLMSVQLTVKKTDDYSFKLQCFNNYGGGRWAYEFIANQPHPTADNLIIVDNGDSFTITASEHFEDSGYKIFRFYPNLVASSTRSLVFKDLMTILGGKPTSYIPTNGTAVTRAADYAHVISKAAINTPTGLLPTGEHSVESTAIRSFKRDTVAWLDGVEYPANTPRYLPNGQLLIESQNTNYMTVPFPYDTLTFKKSDPLTTAIVTAVDGWSDYSVALASGHGYFDIKDSATLYNTLMSVQLTVKKTEDYNFEVRSIAGDGSGFSRYAFIANQPHPAGDKLTIVDNGDSFTITASEHFEASGYTIFRFYPNDVENSTRSLVFKDLMTILGDKPTSYIPTNGTAVTRAADECFVDYQLPPNTYRDLKGFKA